MIWGKSKEGKRILANPYSNASCNICGEQLISKCGTIKIWHWAHKSNKNCDDWAGTETEWHIAWKNLFPEQNQEIIIEQDGKKHIADIQTDKKRVIEFQNSPLSSKEIRERENFYGDMIWILNGKELCSGIELRKRIEEDTWTLRWKNPPKSWWDAKKPIFIDFNFIPFNNLIKEWVFAQEPSLSPEQVQSYKKVVGKLFLIKKIYNKLPCGAYGKIIEKGEFIEATKNG